MEPILFKMFCIVSVVTVCAGLHKSFKTWHAGQLYSWYHHSGISHTSQLWTFDLLGTKRNFDSLFIPFLTHTHKHTHTHTLLLALCRANDSFYPLTLKPNFTTFNIFIKRLLVCLLSCFPHEDCWLPVNVGDFRYYPCENFWPQCTQ